MSTERDPRAVATAYFETWRARDFDAFRELLADDCTFAGPLGTAEDGDAYRQGVARLSEIVDDVVVEHMWVDGPEVLTWFALRTTVAPPVPVANWSHVEDGRITRIRVTFDARPLAPPS